MTLCQNASLKKSLAKLHLARSIFAECSCAHENPTVSMGDTVAEKKEAFKSAYNVALEENLVNKIGMVDNVISRAF